MCDRHNALLPRDETVDKILAESLTDKLDGTSVLSLICMSRVDLAWAFCVNMLFLFFGVILGKIS